MSGEVYKATIQVEVMGYAESEAAFRAQVSGMSMNDIEEETDSGSMIGGSKAVTAVTAIAREDLAGELQAVGNDGTFFDHELEED